MKSILLKGSQLYFQEEIKSANSFERVTLLCPQVSGAAVKTIDKNSRDNFS